MLLRLKACKLEFVWLVLIGLTLFSVLFAENNQTKLSICLVMIAVSLKGQLVIDRLMGLNNARPTIRGLMLAYFVVVPVLITLTSLFPEFLASVIQI
ncbi:hypothetical protein C2869_03805 [Saccharobesus litoralis]|uniref:Uncharacterized protein n=1 Tax=Saccharobesus litoralis TaxID=2172099 RepID=A0A2S0VN20_9ALTE|nr:cytochrome C oxidase subunit IV family protein [Saccharobesus litoralis]AWB65614.1 hypothetical protein C2869_03805 [Saccharobesus litoralis]